MQSKTDRIQGKLERLTKKWWFFLLLLAVFFIPTQAAEPYDRRESLELIEQVLSDPLIFAYPMLMPIAKIIPVVLIAGVLAFGNKMRQVFNAYVAILFLALAVFQTSAVTEIYGLVVITGNLVLLLIVALVWFWELIVRRNNLGIRKRPLWNWWVAPLALVALLAPIDASTMSPDFNVLRMLTNEAGLTACMMIPVVLTVLLLFYPTINLAVLRITSFSGLLLGAVNMLVWFFVEPWGWWMGVLHIPLVVISIYAMVLSLGEAGGG